MKHKVFLKLNRIHPRYKRQIADRLALGAFDVAYADTSSGPYQGPLPTGFSNDGTHIILTHEGFTLEQRGDPTTYFGYEVRICIHKMFCVMIYYSVKHCG